MAQSNFEERIDTYEIESTNVMTGDRDRSRYLYYQLKMSMAKAKQIDIIVSFLMESGVRMLLNDMKRALERGVKIRILTGNYLGITQPSALYLIKSELGDRVDLRLYNETSRSFHPKSYIFHYESSNEIYIGSSNISKSALTSGIEWNYRFSDTLDKKNYELFYATFEDLFLNHSILIDDEELKRYSKAWKKPAVSRDLAKYDATEDGEDRNAENVRMLYRPRGAQIELFGTSREACFFVGSLRERIKQLAKCLGTETTKRFDKEERFDSIFGGDGGIDIVAFTPIDEAGFIPFSFSQCTCSYDKWKDKQTSIGEELWNSYVELGVHYAQYMFVPFSCHNSRGKFCNETRIKTYLIDRLRIIKLIEKEGFKTEEFEKLYSFINMEDII